MSKSLSNKPTLNPPKAVESKGSGEASASTSNASVLDELLSLPKPPEKKQRQRKAAINHMVVCITDDEVLRQLKVTEAYKKAQKENKAKRKASREIL